jgi:tagatose-1,6-bisphosphate aldolase
MIYKKYRIIFIFLIGFLITGCAVIPGPTDEQADRLHIQSIVEKIETAIRTKDQELFMEVISYDYYDSQGRNYADMSDFAEDIIDELKNAEDIANNYGLDIKVKVSIENLELYNTNAEGNVFVNIKATYIIVPAYQDDFIFSTNFVKEAENSWKITAIEEIL